MRYPIGTGFVVIMASLMAITIGCHKKNEMVPSPFSASFNGQPINFTSAKATSTGSGLEIVFIENSRKITLILSGTTPGTYDVENNMGGRVAAGPTAIITAIDNGKQYFGTDGSVILKDENGKVSLETTELTLKNQANETLKISSIKMEAIAISDVPDGCRIASYSYSVSGLSDCYHDIRYSFSYNGDGMISQVYGTGGKFSFTYDLDGKLLGYAGYYEQPGGTILSVLELTYTDTIMTSFTFREAPASDSVNAIYRPLTTYTLSYKNARISGASVSYEVSNGLTDTFTKTILYEGNNLQQVYTAYPGAGVEDTKSYSFFDDKKSPYGLVAKLMASDISFLAGRFDSDFDLFGLNANNPLSRTIWAGQETFSYTYGSHGYPTQIIYTPNAQAVCTGSVTITITYDGC